MNYTKHHIPEFMENLKAGFVLNIRNFDTIDFPQIAEEFCRDDFINAFSYSAFSTKHAKERILEKIFGGFEELKPKEQIEYIKKLDGLTKQSLYTCFAAISRL